MKNYTITVNGNVYDVTVEEKQGQMPSSPVVMPKKVVQTSNNSKIDTPAKAGGIEVKAGAAGKVFKVESAVGTSVKKGDPVVIIEAMKMEIPVVAPEDGTIVSIDVAEGDSITAGQVLATMEA